MARQRLGVVLVIPQPVAPWVNGLRRALGDQVRSRIEPHLTLVPPIEVAERDLPTVFAAVRRAAVGVDPQSRRLGPLDASSVVWRWERSVLPGGGPQ
ncbi:MAG: hypothetical protein EXQ71_01530 [Acidimicrobiia bacterium]|nr:hypothetical protein [Acidimicrobiia bacterium]